MALIKKSVTASSLFSLTHPSLATATQDVEVHLKKARAFAKQQAAERIAAATNQFTLGVNEAAAVTEELKRAVCFHYEVMERFNKNGLIDHCGTLRAFSTR